ncbi:MAG: hypothetical protein NT009_00915 [Proteobacteria bacterium]|nr:hypothetical protein [Pseudomonadota bacterium]
MTKFTPSPAQLKGALEHVFYEITQLIETLIENKNIAVNNALVESRLIHVRVLLDFFQKSARTKMNGKELDDVLSLDYKYAPQTVGIPSPYQDRLNKDLTHLTYSRSERLPTEKLWPHDQVVLPILGCCKQFAEHLISNYLPTNCPKKVTEWQALVDKIKAMILDIEKDKLVKN